MLYTELLKEIEKACEHIEWDIDRNSRLDNWGAPTASVPSDRLKARLTEYQQKASDRKNYPVQAEATALGNVIIAKTRDALLKIEDEFERMVTFLNICDFTVTNYKSDITAERKNSLIEKLLPAYDHIVGSANR